MPQLRRLAIAAEDPAKLAAFYREVFELDKIGNQAEAIFSLTVGKSKLTRTSP
jgi:hypothetical protein